MSCEGNNECGRERAPLDCKRSPFIKQKDSFCTPIVPLSQCKKGFFALLKLYFGSAKKPFWNMNGVCDSAKTIKTDSQIL